MRSMGLRRRSVFVVVAVVLSMSCNTQAQTTTPANEFWPAINATFDLHSRVGVQVYAEKHNGEDVSLVQWKVGTLLSYRLKRILKTHREDIDEENEYNLVIAGGYEFVQTDQNVSSTKREHRVIVQSTPKYTPGAGFLLQNRNRAEFRWVDGTYNFRYRNKLIVDRAFKLNKFRFTPYAAGELFWDRNHHAWTENQYAFGVQLPYKKLLMLDTYYLRQNCTTCSQDPVSVFGIKLNFYFARKRK